MQKASKRRTPGWGVRLTCPVGVIFLCMGMFAGYTFGQSSPPDPKPKAELKEKPVVASGVQLASSVRAKAKTTPITKNRPKLVASPKPQPDSAKKPTHGVRKRGGAAQFEPNPDAKWACDKQTVTQEPTWRGSQQVTFGFDIRNEGTADLKIKARGG